MIRTPYLHRKQKQPWTYVSLRGIFCSEWASTPHQENRRRQTVQFRVQDITLWQHHEHLSTTLPATELFAHCISATLRINNQKNGKRNGTIHHLCTNQRICPIMALIRRIIHIRQYSISPTVMIRTYFTPQQPKGWHITASDINNMLKTTVTSMGLQRFNILPTGVSSHSLRAGGAMALHLNGVPTRTIQIMGRWSSNTFLIYIHEQIAAFSENLSQQMSRNINYHNIAINPSIHT
jgi:Phage integrase family